MSRVLAVTYGKCYQSNGTSESQMKDRTCCILDKMCLLLSVFTSYMACFFLVVQTLSSPSMIVKEISRNDDAAVFSQTHPSGFSVILLLQMQESIKMPTYCGLSAVTHSPSIFLP